MPYAEAMARFGSDKPDLRIPLELIDIKDLMYQVDFKVFSGPANDPNGRVTVLKVPGGASISRKEIDDYTKFIGQYGAKGLAWVKVNALNEGLEGLQSTTTPPSLHAAGHQCLLGWTRAAPYRTRDRCDGRARASCD